MASSLLNTNVHISNLPDVELRRSKFDFNVYSRLQSQPHGRLCPFYCQWVDPGTNIEMLAGAQVEADVSFKKVLDNVFVDIFWFYVPIRLLDPEWENILAGKNVKDPYSEDTYSIPQLRFSDMNVNQNGNFLLNYLGWSAASASVIDNSGNQEGDPTKFEEISAYPYLAFWKIYDEFFRSETLDAAKSPMDYTTRVTGSTIHDLSNNFLTGLTSLLTCPLVNKFHDYFSDAFTTPGESGSCLVPLNTLSIPLVGAAPVGFWVGADATVVNPASIQLPAGEYEKDEYAQVQVAGNGIDGVRNEKIYADLEASGLKADASGIGITIQQLRVSWALDQLSISQQRYGSKYEEFIYGQFGVKLPEYICRPVYLGGTRQALSNIPVIDQSGANLGITAGRSSSALTDMGFNSGFPEHGIVMGLACTRVSHTYSQARNRDLFDMKTREDLYFRQFANFGPMILKNSEIYNDPSDGKNDEAFGYTESWNWKRNRLSTTAGIFSPVVPTSLDYTDFVNRMSYQDLYASRPTLSSAWLKEDPANVMRTLTGKSIPGAGTISATPGATQNATFVFKFYFKESMTGPYPVHANTESLTTRW